MKETGTKRKLAGFVLTAALVIGCLGTAAALAANSGDALPKDTVMTAPDAPVTPAAAPADGQEIQYSKDTYERTDGSQSFVIERWFNPETKDHRSNSWEYTADHQAVNKKSTYYINGGNDLIVLQRDRDGKAVGGTIITRGAQPMLFERYDANYFDFDSWKAFYDDSSWTFIGTEQTADGKTLNKLMQSYQSYISDTTQANMQLIMFIDPDTGLPVREELYEDSTGTFRLFSTDIMEYGYADDDGTLFTPDSGVTLTPSSGAPGK